MSNERELDINEESNNMFNPLSNLVAYIFTIRKRQRALIKLLIKKNLISEDELKQAMMSLDTNDFDQLEDEYCEIINCATSKDE